MKKLTNKEILTLKPGDVLLVSWIYEETNEPYEEYLFCLGDYMTIISSFKQPYRLGETYSLLDISYWWGCAENKNKDLLYSFYKI